MSHRLHNNIETFNKYSAYIISVHFYLKLYSFPFTSRSHKMHTSCIVAIGANYYTTPHQLIHIVKPLKLKTFSVINGDVIHGLCNLIVYIINFMYIRFGNDCNSVNVMDLNQSQSHNNKIF